jgi:dienelactone hydrolase
MLCCHGHFYYAKDVAAGVTDRKGAAQEIARYNGDYGRRLAKKGFVTLCPDVRGFDEFTRNELVTPGFVEYSRQYRTRRAGYGIYRENEDGELEPDKEIFCNLLALEYMYMGQSLLAKRIRDHIVEADYLFSLANVKQENVGVMGLSMGSEHSSYVAGLDQRFRCAVLSCNHVKVRPMIRRRPMGHCQYVPSMGAMADTDDVGCLVPPRPVFVEHGLRDVYDRAETEHAIAKLESAYRCFGVPEHLEVQWFDDGHMFWGRRSIPWLENLLK